MTVIKNVAVFGATGQLGAPIVAELLAAGFTVTAIQRPASADVPGVAATRRADFASVPALTAALFGQDAVVSAMTYAALGSQHAVAEAAVVAGVRRFVPSDFGLKTMSMRGTGLGKLLAPKVALVEHLGRLADRNEGFTWTAISVGWFFNKEYIGFDPKTQTATIYDSGTEPFQVSTFPYIGRAVAAVLSRPISSVTANRYVYVSSFYPLPTQKQILSIAEELTGTKWAVKHESTADLQRVGMESMAGDEPAGWDLGTAFPALLNSWIFEDGGGRAPSEGEFADEHLGLRREELRAAVKAWLDE